MTSSAEDETAAVIKSAVTDGDRLITFDPQNRPGVSALLSTAALCSGEAPEDIATQIGDKGSGELKRLTTDAVNSFLMPLRTRRTELAQNPGLALEVLRRGNDRANAVATKTLDEVRAAMGTIY